MARTSSVFICQQCGFESGKWLGKCTSCGSWGSLVETVVSILKTRKTQTSKMPNSSKPVSLATVISEKTSRVSTNISELDRVLGGGLVPGQVILVAGEPGIGKSTLLLQMADKLDDVLYASGEESTGQIAVRGKRLGVKNRSVKLLEETNVDAIVQVAGQEKPSLLIVDSIQTMTTDDLSGMSGSVGQVKESAYRLTQFAKLTNTPTVIVGQVTKEGTVAGPAILAHTVDTVLWFEGERSENLRILRTLKNRFGPTDEVGIFSMEDKGLIPVDLTDDFFLGSAKKGVSGSVKGLIMEGTRPIAVEIQSLAVPTKLPIPRRIAQGVDAKKLELILAVLTRRCGLNLFNWDVFVNVTGGIVVREPAADLAIALSVASSYFDKPLGNVIAFGEIGLLGGVRKVGKEGKKGKEAKRLGYRQIVNSKEVSFLNQAIKRYLR